MNARDDDEANEIGRWLRENDPDFRQDHMDHIWWGPASERLRQLRAWKAMLETQASCDHPDVRNFSQRSNGTWVTQCVACLMFSPLVSE